MNKETQQKPRYRIEYLTVGEVIGHPFLYLKYQSGSPLVKINWETRMFKVISKF